MAYANRPRGGRRELRRRAAKIFGIGPNGAGKTATLEGVEGLRIPDAGIVRVAGLDPDADHDRVTLLPVGAPARRPRDLEPGDRSELFISEATVKTHLTHVFAKLGAKDRAAAAAVAYERGILG